MTDFLKDFRSAELLNELRERLRGMKFKKEIKIMEVCGTHTMQIHRFGIHQMLPEGVKLISGPGCPVCVTPNEYIDFAVELARAGYTVATFGDMIRVPGSYSSLEKVRAEGGDVRVVYSPMDAYEMAKEGGKLVVFLAIGFETTAPSIAATLLRAEAEGVKNFYVLPGGKLVPPALRALSADPELRISGYLLPGHVSVILGRKDYLFLKELGIPGVISGFEPVDILQSIILLLGLIKEEKAEVVNNYPRAVREEGNPRAKGMMWEVFREGDSRWRGLDLIPKSGLFLREKYMGRDGFKVFDISPPEPRENPACRCGDVLKGLINPPECPLFRKVCTPENPIGPCMVSSEGSCSAWYKFG